MKKQHYYEFSNYKGIEEYNNKNRIKLVIAIMVPLIIIILIIITRNM